MPSWCLTLQRFLGAGLRCSVRLRGQLIGIFAPRGAPLRRGGIEAGQESPCVPRPSCIGESVMAGPHLMRQFGIAKLDGPLLDIETKVRKPEWQLVHPTEQPTEYDPVVSREISPEDRVLVGIDEPANRVADLFPRHSDAVELRTHRSQSPFAGLRPIDFA